LKVIVSRRNETNFLSLTFHAEKQEKAQKKDKTAIRIITLYNIYWAFGLLIGKKRAARSEGKTPTSSALQTSLT
jgi:hypothetical protein